MWIVNKLFLESLARLGIPFSVEVNVVSVYKLEVEKLSSVRLIVCYFYGQILGQSLEALTTRVLHKFVRKTHKICRKIIEWNNIVSYFNWPDYFVFITYHEIVFKLCLLGSIWFSVVWPQNCPPVQRKTDPSCKCTDFDWMIFSYSEVELHKKEEPMM